MPVDIDAEMAATAHERPETPHQSPDAELPGDTAHNALWTGLWGSQHPEGGGPFGGRNNALAKLVGSLRAKRIPFDAALEVTYAFNERQLKPPLDRAQVHEMASRFWANYPSGTQTYEELPTQQGAFVLRTARELLELPESDEEQLWILPNVLLRDGLHFLSAPSAGGKSWVLLEICRCLAAGLPFFGVSAAGRVPVLYIDEEMGPQQTAHRMRLLAFDPESTFTYLGSQSVRLDRADHIEQIVEICRSQGIQIVILDTLTALHPGLRENEVEHVSRLRQTFKRLRSTGAALIVAHHDRKGGQGNTDVAHERMRGSGDLAAMADMVYGIAKRGTCFSISAIKARMLAEDQSFKADFEIRASGERVALHALNAQEAKSHSVRSREQRIIDILAERGEMNAMDLRNAVGGANNLTNDALKRMVESGTVTLTQEGKKRLYALGPTMREELMLSAS